MLRSRDKIEKLDMIYCSWIDGYVYSGQDRIIDVAYEASTDATYVMYNGDRNIYRYDNIAGMLNSQKKVLLSKQIATCKIETFHSVKITDKDYRHRYIYLDYANSNDSTVQNP